MALLTTTQAADRLGITPGRVRQMVLHSEIRAQKIGRDLLLNEADVERAKKRKTRPGPSPRLAPRRKSK